jgi:hypothetical protein
MLRKLCILAVFTLLASSAHAQSVINVGVFQLDFTYDTTGYFTGNSSRLTTLENAAQMVSSLVSTTTLSAISTGTNSWTPLIQNPTTSTTSSITPSDFGADSSLAASTIKVYVGAQGLGGSSAAATTTQAGYTNTNPNQTWIDTLNFRGNGGNYMPWGGTILFNTTLTNGWYFDQDTTLTSGEIGTANDFLSVATHELFHLLGFGVSTTWNSFVTSNTFTGPKAVSNFGNAVPLNGTDHSHWANNAFTSINLVTGASQETMMDPSLTGGTRKYPTQLDAAALRDIGYTVNTSAIPEPADSAIMAAMATLVLALYWRRNEALRS